MSQQPGPMPSRAVAPHVYARRMCRALLLVVLLLPITLPASSGLAGQPAPDFALKNKSGTNYGGNHRLSEYRGQVVLLSFWADWCKRCIDQLETLRELQKRYGEVNLRVLAVNIDEHEQPARDAAKRLGITILHDADQSVVRQYDPSVLPFAVFVDPHGIVRHVHAGYRADDATTYADELAALILE